MRRPCWEPPPAPSSSWGDDSVGLRERAHLESASFLLPLLDHDLDTHNPRILCPNSYESTGPVQASPPGLAFKEQGVAKGRPFPGRCICGWSLDTWAGISTCTYTGPWVGREEEWSSVR